MRWLQVTPLAISALVLLGTAVPNPSHSKESTVAAHPYLGMWVTDDGHVRHHLLPGGRYDEARGTRESAYRGRYAIEGDHIDYVDDTGFTADGDFIDGVLYHGGMVLRRATQAPGRVVPQAE